MLLPDAFWESLRKALSFARLSGKGLPQGESLSEETIYALCRMVKENPLSGIRIAAGMRSPREQQALR